jgi:hypothetical protein
MRAAVNAFLLWSAVAAAYTSPSIATAEEPKAQPGENRWLPSLAVIGGFTAQEQKGSQSSVRFEDSDPSRPSVLRSTRFGDDRVVSPHVGAAFELMTPSVPVPSRPRAFATAEILPTFASERQLSVDGAPARFRGPEVGAVNAVDEDNQHYTTDPRFGAGARQIGFGETDAAGVGMKQNAQVDDLMYGAQIGAAFSFQFRGRQMRIKPSAGWIHYEVDVKGYLVDGTCIPVNNCTPTYTDQSGSTVSTQGTFREAILSGSDSGEFDGVGPGVDLEMDTGRYGPIRTSLFLGFHAYYIPGDRDIYFVATRSYSDPPETVPPTLGAFGPDTDVAAWHTRVDPWLFRAGVGIRFQWLGGAE